MRKALALLAAVAAFALNAAAQQFDLARDRQPISDLQGAWRFHAGDNPAWADPKFDDSQWKLLKPDQPWSAAGDNDTSGFGWYRFSVRIPTGMGPVALFVSDFATSVQVFADGRLIGEWGRPAPHSRIVYGPPQVIPLPPAASGERTVVVAIRSWNWGEGQPGGPGASFRLGSADQIAQFARSDTLSSFWWESAYGYTVMLYLLTGSAGLFLFLLRRSEREYLWFGAYEIANGLFWGLYIWIAFHALGYVAAEVLFGFSFSIADLCLVLFVGAFLKDQYSPGLRLARLSVYFDFAVYLPYAAGPLFSPNHISPKWWALRNSLLLLGNLGLNIGIFYPLWKKARAGVAEASLLFWTFAFYRVAIMGGWILNTLPALGWNWLPSHMGWYGNTVSWPFPIGVWKLTEAITQFALLAILVLRFARSRRDEEKMAAELEAARAVQQVLVPDQIPPVPGLNIECAYKPAGQVGGDFFQILPCAGGGAVVAIGDVSGKGTPAAMTVSLLVGTLRAAAETTFSPAALLTTMNRLLLGRTAGGFTTCLVLHLTQDGHVTASNAGHIAPYRNGLEMPLPNGLPLGLSEGERYAETAWQLDRNESLTLISDGVIEARTPGGELFGFDRAAALAHASAEEIADAAQRFGQEDDITVLRLTRSTSSHEQPTVVEPAGLTPALT